MDKTRDTYGGDERCTQGYDGNLKERYLLEDVGGDGRVMLKDIFKQWDGGVDWINLAQYRYKGWALVKTVRNLRVE
jgi:hypothetical protein